MEYISLSILNFWTNFKLLFEGEINIYLIEVTCFEATLSDQHILYTHKHTHTQLHTHTYVHINVGLQPREFPRVKFKASPHT